MDKNYYFNKMKINNNLKKMNITNDANLNNTNTNNTNTNTNTNTNINTNANINTNNNSINNNINNTNINTINNTKNEKKNLNENKHNPDVLSNYKSINRTNNFEFSNECYKPITGLMPKNITKPDDLVMEKDKYDLMLIQKFNELQNKRDIDNNIVKKMQEKFNGLNVKHIDKNENQYDKTFNSYIELKKNHKNTNTSDNNKINNIFDKLKEFKY